ncbi:hypothetical protein HQ489_04965 [Candidatus Woesearchaeota archaeon]|nr:hypothetical protein [Candidatus Woesearchaeota archaeon]
MDLEWRCTFNFSNLPSGFHQNLYLSKVYHFLEGFVGQEFANNHEFQQSLTGWSSYASRQQLDPQLPGPQYDVRSNTVHIANGIYGYCSFGKLVYLGSGNRNLL